VTPTRRYTTIRAFETALKAKLVSRVSKRRTIQDLRKQLAFDRVLARLSHVALDAWLLKGGVALEYRFERARATTDIDISAQISLEQMIGALEAAAVVELNDYFAIRLGKRSQPVDGIPTYRFKVTVLYENGRIFEELKIDVGFADPCLGEPQELTAPALLDFAGIKPTIVRAVPIEQHLAEKLHAYAKRYGNRDSTRVKDLVDMALLVDHPQLSIHRLAETIRDVFAQRETDVPASLPKPPPSWQVPYPHLAADLPVPQTSDEAYYHVAETIAKALDAIAAENILQLSRLDSEAFALATTEAPAIDDAVLRHFEAHHKV
jgi:predicted nucleotidyltransferase component of viral defense system